MFTTGRFSTWTREQNRVGYRNVQNIRPTNLVRAGRHSSPLPLNLLDLSSFRYTYAGRERTIDDYISDMNVAGLLVLHDGQIVLERYANGHSASSAWTSFSVAKSVVSMLFGAAIADGSIRSLNDTVTRYVAALRGSEYDRVTIRQILQMSSGVKWNEDYDDPRSDINSLPGRFGIDSLLAYMKRLPRSAPPGTLFNYSSGETEVAGAVLRSATRRPLARYLSEKIWTPAGMEANAYWMTLGTSDAEWADCCLSATLRDYGRIGLVAMSGGVAPNGKRILPAGWITESTTPAPTSSTYGYLWWIAAQPGSFGATGIHGQNIYVDPARSIVFVTQSFWDKATSTELIAHRNAFREALTRAVASKSPRGP